VGDLALVTDASGTRLEGTVTADGEYSLTYTVSDGARPDATGTITLNIVPQMKVKATPFWDAYRNEGFAEAPQFEVPGIAPVTYTLLPSSSLPTEGDWKLLKSGQLVGLAKAKEDTPRPVD